MRDRKESLQPKYYPPSGRANLFLHELSICLSLTHTFTPTHSISLTFTFTNSPALSQPHTETEGKIERKIQTDTSHSNNAIIFQNKCCLCVFDNHGLTASLSFTVQTCSLYGCVYYRCLTTNGIQNNVFCDKSRHLA